MVSRAWYLHPIRSQLRGLPWLGPLCPPVCFPARAKQWAPSACGSLGRALCRELPSRYRRRTQRGGPRLAKRLRAQRAVCSRAGTLLWRLRRPGAKSSRCRGMRWRRSCRLELRQILRRLRRNPPWADRTMMPRPGSGVLPGWQGVAFRLGVLRLTLQRSPRLGKPSLSQRSAASPRREPPSRRHRLRTALLRQ